MCQAGRGQAAQGRRAVRKDRDHQVVRTGPVGDLDQRLRADHALLVGHRVRALDHGQPPQVVLFAVLDHDRAARQAVAEQVLQGQGDALRGLARPNHIDVLDLAQVDRLVAIARDVLARIAAHVERLALDAHQLARVGVWVRGGEPRLEDLERQRAALAVAV